MAELPTIYEEDPSLLVSYSIDRDESVSHAIVQAFLATDVAVFEPGSPLADWIDTDALATFDWDDGAVTSVTADLWGYQTVITPDQVRIYTAASAVEGSS